MERLLLKHVIFEKPIAWKRPGRFKARYFDMQAHDKKRLQKIFQITNRGFKPINEPVKLKFKFNFARPVRSNNYHITKPDLSNLIKFYEDCFNKIIWEDDKLIVGYVDSSKQYASEPSTEIYVYGQ